MGKRPTNKTKSGKFMNPTDQARKEARKRELKKNKKQRSMVRTAVLKGKNPREIIAELEKIDDMEFNVHAPPPLNEKVLREKRAKLVGTWNRVIRLYEKDNHEQFMELKKLWHSYLARKNEVAQHYEAVKNAERVNLEEIPLPSSMPDDRKQTEEIPLPPKSSILKKPSSVLDSLKPRVCPGVPSGPPPPLSDYDDDDDRDGEEDGRPHRKIRFEDENDGGDMVAPGEEDSARPKVDDLQRKMLAMAGQDVDQYMKEMEEVHRQTQAEKANDLQNRLSRIDDLNRGEPGPPGIGEPEIPRPPPGPPPGPPPQQQQQQQQQQKLHHLAGPPGIPPGPPPRPPMFIRPSAPPLRPGVPPPGVRLPPGPPPGRPPAPPGPPPGRPPMPQQQQQQQQPRPGGVRQLPQRSTGGIVSTTSSRPNASRPQGVLSAGPQLIKSGGSGGSSGGGGGGHNQSGGSQSSASSGSVIEAKPQMRNLRSDITRFIPTNLRIKRDDPKNLRKQIDPMTKDLFGAPKSVKPAPQTSKDDAYAQFMSEMDKLLK